MEYFDTIKLIGNGNCLFRTVSYYLNKTENNYSALRTTVYNYVKNNITEFLNIVM